MKTETSTGGAIVVAVLLALLLVAALVRLGLAGEGAPIVPTPTLLPTPPISVPLATSTAGPAAEPTAAPRPSPTVSPAPVATVTPPTTHATPTALPATGSR